MEWTPPEPGVLAPPSDCKKIVYEVQESEFVEGYFNTVLDANARMRLIILVCISVAIAGFVFFIMADTSSALICTAITVAFAVAGAKYFKWQVCRDIRKNYKAIADSLEGPIELLFGEGFIGARTPRDIVGTTILYGMAKLPNLRLVFSSPKVFFVVPLRAFSSTSDIEEFDRIVEGLSR